MDGLSSLVRQANLLASLDVRCQLAGGFHLPHDDEAAGTVPFHLVLSGECQVQTAAEIFPVRGGDFVLLPRGSAHAVHNGLTVLPQTEKFLHGTKVAYGILVQSALLGQDDVLAQLTGAYQRFHLPTTLAELEVDINNQAEIDKVIAHTLRPVESIHYLPVTLTPDTLRAAFKKVESFKA